MADFIKKEIGCMAAGDALTFPAMAEYFRNCKMPRKVRQLVSDLQQAGFVLVPGGKGSHRKFRHPKVAGSVILSGKDGDDAQHYQEKQIRNAIREAGNESGR